MHLLVLGAFLQSSTPTLTPRMASGLNAPYGAWCFLTVELVDAAHSICGLNAPYDAWCFLTCLVGKLRQRRNCIVLMCLMALGAF